MARPSATEPAYRKLATILRSDIAAGRYRGGVRLPTEAELGAEYGLSRQTVRRAFVDLVAEGVVHRVPGRGTFATEHPRERSDGDSGRGLYLRQLGSIDDLMNLSADTSMEVVEPPRRLVDLDAAGRLRLDTDLVYRMVFRRRHDGTPFVLTTVWLPQEVARPVLDHPDLAAGAISAHTIIGLLEPHLRSPIIEASQSITVAHADTSTAARLDSEAGHAMLRVDRLYRDAGGAAVELAVSYFLPEHYTYRVTLHRSTE